MLYKTWVLSTAPPSRHKDHLKATREGNVVTTNHNWALTKRANYTQGTKTDICALSRETQRLPCRGVCSKGFKQQQNVSVSSQQHVWWVTWIGKDWNVSFSKPHVFSLRTSVVLNMDLLLLCTVRAWLTVGSPWMGVDWYIVQGRPVGMLGKPAF